MNGVVVRENSKYHSWFLDMTPGSNTNDVIDRYDPALPVGSSAQDPFSGIKITAESLSAQSASVRIEFTDQRSCRLRKPYLKGLPSSVRGMPGSPIQVTATLDSLSSLESCLYAFLHLP